MDHRLQALTAQPLPEIRKANGQAATQRTFGAEAHGARTAWWVGVPR